jgi:hypothetical protein
MLYNIAYMKGDGEGTLLRIAREGSGGFLV